MQVGFTEWIDSRNRSRPMRLMTARPCGGAKKGRRGSPSGWNMSSQWLGSIHAGWTASKICAYQSFLLTARQIRPSARGACSGWVLLQTRMDISRWEIENYNRHPCGNPAAVGENWCAVTEALARSTESRDAQPGKP